MNESLYKTEYMNNLLRYIENNVSADLDTELLSNIGYVSYGKLKHDFYSLSGHSVKEYIRKRRLSNALALIKMSDMSLTDIALECGYSSHQTLCRTVKQTLGMTPTEYKNGSAFYFFPPFIGEPLHSVTVSSHTIPRMLCFSFYHTKLIGIENMAVTTFLQAFPNYSGRIFGRNGKQKGTKFCYEIYLTDTDINYDILTSFGFEMPRDNSPLSGIFATTTVRNDEDKINFAWNYLYSIWLSNSMFRYSGELYYEEYMMRNDKPFKLKLYLPIRPRDEDTRITLIDNPGLRFVTAKAHGLKAEEIASQTVIEYITANCPHAINVSKETYIQKGINTCVCGIKLSPAIQLTDNENVKSIYTDQDKYLVLSSSVMGDYDQTAAFLLAFANDNGIIADSDGVFAVYDATKGFNNLRMKMYLPIRI